MFFGLVIISQLICIFVIIIGFFFIYPDGIIIKEKNMIVGVILIINFSILLIMYIYVFYINLDGFYVPSVRRVSREEDISSV